MTFLNSLWTLTLDWGVDMDFLQELSRSFRLEPIITAFLRLVLAAVLGGFIGHEREHTNRPAGLRTHALVCVGSALIMLVSEYAYTLYGNMVDPTRLGAQVISGIGFLGAGTIIKEGFNVKGLTTAASIWVVSCIGLALGMGYYSGAIMATGLIYCTLLILKKIIIKRANSKTICLMVSNVDDVYHRAMIEFKRLKLTVYNTQIITSENGEAKELRFYVSSSDKELFNYVLMRVRMIDGVLSQRLE